MHAQKQGQTAAANLLGCTQPFTDVPFCWTHHYGVDLRWVGLTNGWDPIRFHGSVDAQDFLARYYRSGILIDAASIGRDLDSLRIEAERERVATCTVSGGQ